MSARPRAIVRWKRAVLGIEFALGLRLLRAALRLLEVVHVDASSDFNQPGGKLAWRHLHEALPVAVVGHPLEGWHALADIQRDVEGGDLLVDFLGSVDSADAGLDCGEHVVGDQRRAEGEQRRLGIAQRRDRSPRLLSNSWKAVSMVQRLRYGRAITSAGTESGRLVSRSRNLAPSRVGLSRRRPTRRAGSSDPALMSTICCSFTSPVSTRPAGSRPPANRHGAFPECSRVMKKPPRAAMPLSNPAVQKFRSSIQRSLASTVASSASVLERSCA